MPCYSEFRSTQASSRNDRTTTYRLTLLLILLGRLFAVNCLPATRPTISGSVTDPQSNPVHDLRVQLSDSQGASVGLTTTDKQGRFSFSVDGPGVYTLGVNAPGFQQVRQSVEIHAGQPTTADVHLGELRPKQESITVTADVRDSDVLFPDPAQRVYVHQELLDANPGRPGAPLSIPGVPVETASGGIKAPQYFSPGTAGDHGEPIAQYIQVGTYLVSNNLSANAHGNGYADPNIVIAPILDGVQTDGGAFNVREGNHAESLAATYQLRSRLEPFITVTGDYRDIDVVAGWSPESSRNHSFVAIETAYGNGFLDRLEHRQQYKLNGFRVWSVGNHQFTLFGVGYYGFSYIPGLVPLNVPNLHDTIDPRQQEQTHTGLLTLNDVWKIGRTQALQFSSLFRTYSLSLASNFGAGLIRQSEFRTVAGGNTTYVNNFAKSVSFMAGIDYQRDAPRRLNLDHWDNPDPAFYGPFQQVTSNNVTLTDVAPYIAVSGSLPYQVHYYLGWRRDEIQIDNQDLLNPANSYRTLAGFNSPKATLSFLPEGRTALPSISFSFGEAFYTNDPRIGIGAERGTPISREHSYQLVVSKEFAKTDFRVTLGHITTEATLAKIDADTGLEENEGPGRNKFITVAARRYFGHGFLQASVSKADARDLDSGLPTPEAPRLIVDVIGALSRLPFGLEARAEFEQVGAKPLGDGFTSVPVREFRGAVVRAFLKGRMDAGLNFLIASGYTGQTLQVVSVGGRVAPFEQVSGVRLASYVSASYSYHFRP